MKTKDDILQGFDRLLGPGVKEQEIVLSIAYQFLEVFIDIRDILASELSGIARALYVISNQD